MSDRADISTARRRFPPWLTKRLAAGGQPARVAGLIEELHLATVCTEARCPNRNECHARGTATFLILGKTCTRCCRFCAVEPGRPAPLRGDEPEAVAAACERMRLRYVVITSVTRDDLPDGGAEHFARTVRAVHNRIPKASVEVLTPDFLGRRECVDTILEAGVDVFGHNVETVPRLQATVRPEANYSRSLELLSYARRRADQAGPAVRIKSGLMVGLGERDDEVDRVMRDLRQVGCDILTIGQYLAPSPEHEPVARFVEPARFDAWRQKAEAMGFSAAAAGPFVRSSYRAEEVLQQTGNEQSPLSIRKGR